MLVQLPSQQKGSVRFSVVRPVSGREWIGLPSTLLLRVKGSDCRSQSHLTDCFAPPSGYHPDLLIHHPYRSCCQLDPLFSTHHHPPIPTQHSSSFLLLLFLFLSPITRLSSPSLLPPVYPLHIAPSPFSIVPNTASVATRYRQSPKCPRTPLLLTSSLQQENIRFKSLDYTSVSS